MVDLTTREAGGPETGPASLQPAEAQSPPSVSDEFRADVGEIMARYKLRMAEIDAKAATRSGLPPEMQAVIDEGKQRAELFTAGRRRIVEGALADLGRINAAAAESFEATMSSLSGPTSEPTQPPAPIPNRGNDSMRRFEVEMADMQDKNYLFQIYEQAAGQTHLKTEDVPTDSGLQPGQAEEFLQAYIVHHLGWESQPRGYLGNNLKVDAAVAIIAMPNEAARTLFDLYNRKNQTAGATSHLNQEDVTVWLEARILDPENGLAGSVAKQDSRIPRNAAPPGENVDFVRELILITKDREARKALILKAMEWFKSNQKQRHEAQGAPVVQTVTFTGDS